MGLKLSRPPVTISPPVSLSEIAGGRAFKSYKSFFLCVHASYLLLFLFL
jgi:endonuclease IV